MSSKRLRKLRWRIRRGGIECCAGELAWRSCESDSLIAFFRTRYAFQSRISGNKHRLSLRPEIQTGLHRSNIRGENDWQHEAPTMAGLNQPYADALLEFAAGNRL
jgi:hypothetical protein